MNELITWLGKKMLLLFNVTGRRFSGEPLHTRVSLTMKTHFRPIPDLDKNDSEERVSLRLNAIHRQKGKINNIAFRFTDI
jgi:hypothetical protein